MDDSICVTLVANAGLLLKYQETTLLLDGIYGTEKHIFSNPSPETWRKMLCGIEPFSKIDYLLFTHAHWDHFSPAMTLEYLKARKVKGVFMPDIPEVAELKQWLSKNGIPCALLSDETNRIGFPVAPKLTVRAFETKHTDKMGTQYTNVRHFCYLILFGEKKVLFTADMSYTEESLEQLQGIDLHAVFINPMFLAALRQGKLRFRGELRTDSIYVYHVPFAEDDERGIRKKLWWDMERWNQQGRTVFSLTEPLQRAFL